MWFRMVQQMKKFGVTFGLILFVVAAVLGCGHNTSIYTTGGEGSFGENPAKPGSYGPGNHPVTQPTRSLQ
jgi:hypothetical protein